VKAGGKGWKQIAADGVEDACKREDRMKNGEGAKRRGSG
jgi:hypothetical protein